MGSICSSSSAVDFDGTSKIPGGPGSYSDAKDMLRRADEKEMSKIASMKSVHDSILEILEGDSPNDVLALTIPTRHFGDFIDNLEAMITLIHGITESVYIPICISHSPVNPSHDFLVVFRKSENVKCFPLDGWFTTNIPQLAKKFFVKTVGDLDETNPEEVQSQLDSDLKTWYTDERLNLIGGFQDEKQQL